MKDGRGQDLKLGDDVILMVQQPHVTGRIVAINEGTLITGLKRGGSEISPCTVTVIAQFTIAGPAREPMGNILKLAVTPEQEAEQSTPPMLKALQQ